MSPPFRILLRAFSLFGFNPRVTVNTLRCLPGWLRDYRTLRKQAQASNSVEFPFGTINPQLQDRYDNSGVANGHYFHQDLLVARRIHQNNPGVHADIGSQIAGFVAHVASFRPIEVFDIRPLTAKIPNVTFRQIDLMCPPPPNLIEAYESLSCLHALEHFGLGRYGDPLNYEGHLLGLAHLRQIVKRGGKLYFSVPIGPKRIEFNAHRVFSVRYLLEYFTDKFHIDQFSYVDDAGDLFENVPLRDADIDNNYGCHYGCGIFELTKY